MKASRWRIGPALMGLGTWILFSLAPRGTHAGGLCRVGVFLSETVGGAAASVGVAEALEQALTQLEQVSVVGGGGPEGRSDLDLLVVGDVELTRRPDALRDVVAYEGRVRLRLVAADSGEVFASVQKGTLQPGFTSGSARAKVSAELGAKIFEALDGPLRGACRAGRLFELRVELQGPTGPGAAARVRDWLAKVPDVEAVALRRQDGALFSMTVKTSLEPLELAEAIEQIGAGVRIHGVSSRQIHAKLALGELLAIELTTRPFRASDGLGPRYQHLSTDLPRLIATGLAGLDMVQLVETRRPARGAAKSNTRGRLQLEGSFGASEEELWISAVLRSADSGQELLAVQKRCTGPSPFGCAIRVAEVLMAELPLKVMAQAGALGAVGALVDGPQHVAIRASHTLDALYPAMAARYRHAPLGALTISNTGAKPIRELELDLQIIGLSSRSHRHSVGTLKPNADREVAVSVALNESPLRRWTQAKPATIRVRMSYRLGEEHFRSTETIPLMVLDRNALRWDVDEGQRIAAFVHHEGTLVRALAAEIQAASPPLDANPLGLPLLLFRALDGLRYRRDRAQPHDPQRVDHVLFPEETLVAGGGDCDDLAVAYAALAEAIGQPAALILLPQHVLAAVAVPFETAESLSTEGTLQKVVWNRGRAWLPVETTLVGAPFEHAWTTAARRLARVDPSQIQVVEVRAAWSEGFRPMPVDVEGSAKNAFDLERVRAGLAREAEKRAN